MVDFLVLCTFDLKNATSQNYVDAYNDLLKFGLKKVQVADNGSSCVIPTTTAMGVLQGTSAAAVRDYVSNGVQAAFRQRGFTSEIFVTAAGGDWGWGARVT